VRRRQRTEYIPVDRFQFLLYTYTIHYFLFSAILFIMQASGAFDATDGNTADYLNPLLPRPKYDDVSCSPAIQLWFFAFLILCPLYALSSWAIAIFRAKHHHDTFTYSLETLNRVYVVKSSSDRIVNYTALAIEYSNLLWAILGTIFDKAYAVESTKRGAISNCMRDYGMNTCLMAYVFITMGYAQIMRLAVYQGIIMNHRCILGYLEGKFRADRNRFRRGGPNEEEVEVKFVMIGYQSDHLAPLLKPESHPSQHDRDGCLILSTNKTCSICC